MQGDIYDVADSGGMRGCNDRRLPRLCLNKQETVLNIMGLPKQIDE